MNAEKTGESEIENHSRLPSCRNCISSHMQDNIAIRSEACKTACIDDCEVIKNNLAVEMTHNTSYF
ncbi:unnamed protein product [Leptidea sinapis]|uniref:Uncharacterized protein n=1 Tax=Leptidea sinapis TaxID=189913 RepID=A0A5E4Q966_9NEOP|nr:unnamed protein product [Leptidea sinapis]